MGMFLRICHMFYVNVYVICFYRYFLNFYCFMGKVIIVFNKANNKFIKLEKFSENILEPR